MHLNADDHGGIAALIGVKTFTFKTCLTEKAVVNKGNPNSRRLPDGTGRLGFECETECDADADCMQGAPGGSLKCHFRSGTERVPGCSFSYFNGSGWDACYYVRPAA